MAVPRKYLAEIGRRGGIKSRRKLEPVTARLMVARREARRAARNSALERDVWRSRGIPADTATPAQAVQDTLLRRRSPAEKLAMVARLSRMVDRLSIEGLKIRHPDADDESIQRLRAELRLGESLATVVLQERLTRA